MKDYRDIIKRNVKLYRSRMGLKQSELSALFGLSGGAVSAWESPKGNLMSADTLFQLCDIFGCSADDIAGRSVQSITPDDQKLLTRFHQASEELQKGVCRLLDVEPAKKGDAKSNDGNLIAGGTIVDVEADRYVELISNEEE